MDDNEKAINLLTHLANRLKQKNVKVKGMDFGIEFGKSTVGKRIIPDPSKRVTTVSIRTEESND